MMSFWTYFFPIGNLRLIIVTYHNSSETGFYFGFDSSLTSQFLKTLILFEPGNISKQKQSYYTLEESFRIKSTNFYKPKLMRYSLSKLNKNCSKYCDRRFL